MPDRPELIGATRKAPLFSGMTSVGGNRRRWFGTGWTGQPVVREYEGGLRSSLGLTTTICIFWIGHRRAHTPRVHTNDIIKGTPSLDPDGYPRLFRLARQLLPNRRHRRSQNRVLWRLNGNRSGKVWNNDWDGNGKIVNDYLVVGGENSLFYVIKLNRHYDDPRKSEGEPAG